MKLPRYSLRAMLITVTIIAAVVGYLAQQARVVAQRKAFLKSHSGIPSSAVTERQTKPAPWALRLLGAEPMYVITVNNKDDVAEARRLFPEAEVVERRSWIID